MTKKSGKSSKSVETSLLARCLNFFQLVGQKIKMKIDKYLARRPHRSFRRTRRRDYIKPLKLPGYWLFSLSVWNFLKSNKKIFLLLALTYAILTGVMVGIASQDTYISLTDLLKDTGGKIFEGDFGQLSQAALLLTTIIGGGISNTPTEAQQIYGVLIGLMTWLATVWIVRNILAGNKVKLRDGLYNSGAPILSSFLVMLVIIVQLLPFAIAAIGYSAAVATGLLNNGVEAMLFWIAAGLLTSLSLYWVTSTFMAMIVVSLPGMYPLQAIQTAGDLVVGRRLRILYRMLWMALWICIAWVVVMVPIIIFDTWLKTVVSAIDWLPVVPFALLAMSSLTVVWVASYIYLLYRKIIDNDAT